MTGAHTETNQGLATVRPKGGRLKVVLYNPQAVFFTMPLALLAIGSELDPEIYEVVTIDGRLDPEAEKTVASHLDTAVCLGVTVLTGAPISDALRISRAAKRARPNIPVVWGGWHPSMFARECLDEPSVDVTVQAQGEGNLRGNCQPTLRGPLSRGMRRMHCATPPMEASSRIRHERSLQSTSFVRTTMG